MNDKLKKHWKESGLSKTEYAPKIGISRRYLTRIFENKNVLKPATFDSYMLNFEKSSR